MYANRDSCRTQKMTKLKGITYFTTVTIHKCSWLHLSLFTFPILHTRPQNTVEYSTKDPQVSLIIYMTTKKVVYDSANKLLPNTYIITEQSMLRAVNK